MKENYNFKNKNILITGGTSGLGKSLAIQLHELGANVAVVARRRGPLQEMADKLPGLVTIEGDISNKKAIHPLSGKIHSKLGDVDILCNVASELGPTPLRMLIDTECEDFEKVLQTNLLGPFRLTKTLLPAMLLKKSGLVLNISSDAAINAYPTWGSYSISKASIDHMSQIFDVELKKQGVRFLSIDPGDMNTPMHFAAIPEANPDELKSPELSAMQIIKIIEAQDFSSVRRKA